MNKFYNLRGGDSYQSLDNSVRHHVQRIIANSNGRLSLQWHHHRSEHLVVVRGTARVIIDEEIKTIHENEVGYIPIGTEHRLEYRADQ